METELIISNIVTTLPDSNSVITTANIRHSDKIDKLDLKTVLSTYNTVITLITSDLMIELPISESRLSLIISSIIFCDNDAIRCNDYAATFNAMLFKELNS